MRPVARLRDLLVNVALRVELTPTEAVSIVKLKDNSVVAVGDSCCHKDAKLSKGDIEDLGVGVSACVGDGTELGGVCLRCPKHKKKFAGGLYFNAKTGRAYVKGPAEKFKPEWRVPVYTVAVEGDVVFINPVPKTEEEIASEGGRLLSSTSVSGAEAAPGPAVGMFQQWTLSRVTPVSADSSLYTFTTPALSCDAASVYKALRCHCWHVSLRLLGARGTTVTRDYTPVSDLQQWYNRKIDILIKIYPGGELTSALALLPVGSSVDVSSPEVTLFLPTCTMNPAPWPPVNIHDVVLIGGGTGIAPFAQLFALALGGESGPEIFGASTLLRLTLLYSNHTEKDILWRDTIDDAAAMYPSTVRVLHTLTAPTALDASPEWNGATKRISPAMLAWAFNWGSPYIPDAALAVPAPVTDGSYARSVVLCGPQGLLDSVTSTLVSAGVPPASIVALDP